MLCTSSEQGRQLYRKGAKIRSQLLVKKSTRQLQLGWLNREANYLNTEEEKERKKHEYSSSVIVTA